MLSSFATRSTRALACAAYLLGAASAVAAPAAQILRYPGPSPNIPTAAVDFDAPCTTLGPGPPAATPGDDCAAPIVITQGATPYATFTATPSPEPWINARSTSGDLWFEYTTVDQGKDLEIDLCGGSLVTNLEVYSGTCGALELTSFDVHGCSRQSRLLIPNIDAAQTYLIRVAGLGERVGVGSLTVAENDPPAPAPGSCFTTSFTADGTTAPGGAVYFDLSASSDLTFIGLDLETPDTHALGLEVYTIPGSYVGQTAQVGGAGWTLVAQDDGDSMGLGMGQRSHVRFDADWTLPEGNWGVALVGSHTGSTRTTRQSYSDDQGTSIWAQSPDGTVTFESGLADHSPWSGGQIAGAAWNGALCSALTPIGEAYCWGNLHGAGVVAEIAAYGARRIDRNHVTIVGTEFRTHTFSFGVTSRAPGFEPARGFVNGFIYSGNICLSGSIGRLYGPGQVQSTGSAGEIRVDLDLNAHPTPTGLVPVLPGETWYFQLWMRDGGTGPGSNMTGGIGITFE